MLLGVLDPGLLSGAGFVFKGADGVVVLSGDGTGVVSEGLVPGVVVPGTVIASGADGVVAPEGLESGMLVLPGVSGVGVVVVPVLGAPVSIAVPPGQREFSGERSHRIFMPSGDILISVGEPLDELSA
jgi:hypothetical protein